MRTGKLDEIRSDGDSSSDLQMNTWATFRLAITLLSTLLAEFPTVVLILNRREGNYS